MKDEKYCNLHTCDRYLEKKNLEFQNKQQQKNLKITSNVSCNIFIIIIFMIFFYYFLVKL